ncbi:ferritin-like domain-containing protein [Mucilaginibacter arboris]|uniref:PA2169 family four-helix-bundle protein n=1 Tax=Mucilaginibacter arboris TaxID=2682090 RepID=A0A7K1SY02_9SPHI|nr:PA2169 family four-helix-bundle protein [Mucilaginibacter arboris]MVN22196.1 PA2169 family four-helix-bundle protein [Mucilaginibacter arboris]
MIQNEATIEVLNDLIEINNDRIAGYDKAIKESTGENADLKELFEHMVHESHECKMALATEVLVLKGEAAEGTTNSGKIYRAWMDVKATFTGHDRHSILANCEKGEDAAQSAYKSALAEEDLPKYLHDMIAEQQAKLKFSHDKIKMLRDMQS